MAGPVPTPVTRSDFEQAGLAGWTWRDGDTPALVAGFLADGYTAAAEFAVEVAAAADDAVHHPDIDIRYPRHVRVVLVTHETGGVSDLDLALAATIDALAAAGGIAYESATPR